MEHGCIVSVGPEDDGSHVNLPDGTVGVVANYLSNAQDARIHCRAFLTLGMPTGVVVRDDPQADWRFPMLSADEARELMGKLIIVCIRSRAALVGPEQFVVGEWQDGHALVCLMIAQVEDVDPSAGINTERIIVSAPQQPRQMPRFSQIGGCGMCFRLNLEGVLWYVPVF